MNMLKREDLYKAYFNCVKNKRNTLAALKFEINLEKNLERLYSDIVSGNYKVGRSSCIIVKENYKAREIWTGCFRDKIVHHLIYGILKERYFSSFILNVFNGIDTRGILLGALTAQCYAEDITDYGSKKAYYLKTDISNFFNSIDKNILFEIIKRDITNPDEQWLVNLIGTVIFDNPAENPAFCPPKKIRDIIPKEKRLNFISTQKGLPIGNLVSQFFSNIYLNELDQFVLNELHFIRYCRFADDMIFFHENPQYLNFIYKQVKQFLNDKLELVLHPRKKCINLISKGFDFIGYVIKPNRIHLRSAIVNKSFYQINKWKNLPDKFSETKLIEIRDLANGYLGLANKVDNYKFRKKVCKQITGNLFVKSDEEFHKIILN